VYGAVVQAVNRSTGTRIIPGILFMLEITVFPVPVGAADPSGDGTLPYSAPVIKRRSAAHLSISLSLTGRGPSYPPSRRRQVF